MPDQRQKEVDPIKTKLDYASILQDMRQAEEQHNLDLRLKQESHQMDLVSKAANIQGPQGTKDQVDLNGKIQKQELDLAESTAKGIIPPSAQDPVVPQVPKEPVTLHDRLASILANNQKLQGQEPSSVTDESLNLIASKINEAIRQIDNEKTLANSGPLGILFGGLLNTIPGLNLGTKVFGSEYTPRQKLDILNKTLYSVSPAFRTELSDALGNRKLSYQEKLRQSGLGGTASLVHSEEQAKAALGTRFGIERILVNDAGKYFDPKSEMPVGAAFNAYLSSAIAAGKISSGDNDPNNLKEFDDSSAQMEATIRQLISNGMTEKEFMDAMDSAQTAIGKSEYFNDLPLSEFSTTSKDLHMLRYTQMIAANEYKGHLANFTQEGLRIFAQEAGKKAEGEKVDKMYASQSKQERYLKSPVFRGSESGVTNKDLEAVANSAEFNLTRKDTAPRAAFSIVQSGVTGSATSLESAGSRLGSLLKQYSPSQAGALQLKSIIEKEIRAGRVGDKDKRIDAVRKQFQRYLEYLDQNTDKPLLKEGNRVFLK